MRKYLVWYKTRSGKYTREIVFNSYASALNLYNALERDIKYLIEFDKKNGIHRDISP